MIAKLFNKTVSHLVVFGVHRMQCHVDIQIQ